MKKILLLIGMIFVAMPLGNFSMTGCSNEESAKGLQWKDSHPELYQGQAPDVDDVTDKKAVEVDEELNKKGGSVTQAKLPTNTDRFQSSSKRSRGRRYRYR